MNQTIKDLRRAVDRLGKGTGRIPRATQDEIREVLDQLYRYVKKNRSGSYWQAIPLIDQACQVMLNMYGDYSLEESKRFDRARMALRIAIMDWVVQVSNLVRNRADLRKNAETILTSDGSPLDMGDLEDMMYDFSDPDSDFFLRDAWDEAMEEHAERVRSRVLKAFKDVLEV